MLGKRALVGAVIGGFAMGASSFMAGPAQAGFLFAFEDGALTQAEILSSLSDLAIDVTGAGGSTADVTRVDSTVGDTNLIPTIVPPQTFTVAAANAIIDEVANDGSPGGNTLEGVGTGTVTYDLTSADLFLFVKAANWELVFNDQNGSGTTETFVLADVCTSCGSIATLGDISNLRVFFVPLPAALPLFLSALGALGFFGWKRKRLPSAVPATA